MIASFFGGVAVVWGSEETDRLTMGKSLFPESLLVHLYNAFVIRVSSGNLFRTFGGLDSVL